MKVILQKCNVHLPFDCSYLTSNNFSAGILLLSLLVKWLMVKVRICYSIPNPNPNYPVHLVNWMKWQPRKSANSVPDAAKLIGEVYTAGLPKGEQCVYLQQDKLTGLGADQRFVLEMLHEIINISERAMTKREAGAGPHDVEMLDRMLELDRQCVLSASFRTGAQQVSSVLSVLEKDTFCCMSREIWVKPVQRFNITALLRHDFAVRSITLVFLVVDGL